MADNKDVVLNGTPSQKLSETLLGFRRTKKFCDVTLVSGERSFYAHSCVLAAVSPYFLGMLRSGMSDVKVASLQVNIAFLSVRPWVINSVLDFIYGQDITVNSENVFELLVVTDYLLLAELKSDICSFLCQNMSVVNHGMCFLTRRYAEMYGCKLLYEFSDKFLKRRFYQLGQTTSFCELGLDELEYFLASDDLVANEDEVLRSVITWVNYLPGKRKEFFCQLVQHIRPNVLLRECVLELLTGNNLSLEDGDLNTFVSSCPCPKDEGRLGQQAVLALGCKTQLSLCYQPVHNEWCSFMLMPKSRHGFKAVELNGLIYVLGGIVDNKLSLTVWSYNPEQNLWSKVAPMLKTASSFGVATLNGCLYAVGGHSLVYSVQQYDPILNSWCFVKPMNVQRDDHCLVALQDKYLFAIGGLTPSTESMYSVERYDLENSAWSDVARLNIGRIESSAVAVNEKIYVVGGYGGARQHFLSSCEVYHSVFDNWCIIASTIIPRCAAGIAVITGKVYIFGGNPGKHIDVECYSEKSKEWETVGLYANAGQKLQCCTVVLSGKALCNLLE